MKKTAILLIVLLLIFITSLTFLYFGFLKQRITGVAILNHYTLTKAICNETNYCQDYEIVCRGEEIVSMNSLTGMAVQHSSDWEDPRNESIRNKLC